MNGLVQGPTSECILLLSLANVLRTGHANDRKGTADFTENTARHYSFAPLIFILLCGDPTQEVTLSIGANRETQTMRFFSFQYFFYSPKKIKQQLGYLLLAACLQPMNTARATDSGAKPKPDVLVFSNGDKLTGKLDHEAAGIVFFSSDNAGLVKVPWKKLKAFHTDQPFAVIETGAHVRRKNANTDVLIGTVEVNGDTLTVNTSQGSQDIPIKNISYLVDQATFVKNVAHGQAILQGITGSITAGASTVNSTQNSESLNTGVLLTRAVPAVAWMPARQRSILNFTSTYGRISGPNTPTVKTNILHAGVEEDEYFSPRFYLLQQVMFDHNFSQGLDLQQLYGIGVGFTAIKNAKRELDLNAAVNYTKQEFAAPTTTSPNQTPSATQNLIGSTFGDVYTYKLPRKIVLTELVTYTPEWNAPQDYSFNGAVGANMPIFKNFGLSVQIIDSYLNDPAPGFLGNSLQFNTGLSYSIQ